jgi:ferredoxin
VIGVPDERLLEVRAAFIELALGSVLTADEVIPHCKGSDSRIQSPPPRSAPRAVQTSASKTKLIALAEDAADGCPTQAIILERRQSD